MGSLAGWISQSTYITVKAGFQANCHVLDCYSALLLAFGKVSLSFKLVVIFSKVTSTSSVCCVAIPMSAMLIEAKLSPAVLVFSLPNDSCRVADWSGGRPTRIGVSRLPELGS